MRETYLRRYTDLPALIYLLSKWKITLLNPASWDDKNDSHYLSVYKDKKGLQSLLALCFTQVGERYHHWRVFAGNPGGVCIQFKSHELLETLERQEGIKVRSVDYLMIKNIREGNLELDSLPFVKRKAFKDEHELRAIYESQTRQLCKLDISIPQSCIATIKLSPWLNPDLVAPVKRMLKSIEGCGDLRIVRSSLISSKTWRDFADSAV